MFVDGFTSGQTAYQVVKSRESAFVSKFEKLPTYKREVDYYKAEIKDIRSVDDLLKDRRLLKVALSAFQLEDEVDKKALIRKFIVEDPNDKKSLANRMLDPRWQKFAKAFHSLSKDGGAAIRNAASVEAVLGGYRTNEFEKAMGGSNPAVREALFFRRQAPGFKSTAEFLGNAVTAKVVRTALGLPDAFGALDVKQQLQMLKTRGFDPKKFAEPKFVDQFVNRYLSAVDRQASASGAGSPALQLLRGVGSSGLNVFA